MDTEKVHDPAFDAIPVGSTFFLVWRIKKFQLVPVPPEEYGKFYKGDCYIIICCSEIRNTGHSKMEVTPLRKEAEPFTDIHFWIGSQSSTDESAVAAIKSVELDDFLGGSPVQHREVEGYESKQFLAYFRNGIRLLNGGFESGFHKVRNELHPALYQVKGKKRPLMHELNEISWSSMNDGDVFLLIVPEYIFLWTGKKSNHFERLAAINIANDLRDELDHFHLSVVILDDDQEMDQMSDHENVVFNRVLPLELKDDLIQKTEDIDWTNDEKFECTERKYVHLYQCHESEEGKIEIKSLKDGPLTREDLVSTDTFIVDNGKKGIWIWVGKQASPSERSTGLKYGVELIRTKGYPAKTEITKVIEDGETVEFKSLFKQWSPTGLSHSAKLHARLFKLLPRGKFCQIVNYDQDDLEEDNAMVLDAGEKIFVWLGTHLHKKFLARIVINRIGKLYLKKDKSGRDIDSEQIIYVKQGSEEEDFKEYFNSWK